jgi:putative transposase
MKSDSKLHHQRSIRVKGYDYSQVGAYFVTMVNRRRECRFGEIIGGEMKLNRWGEIADECWRTIPEHFPSVELGAHIVMPNHVHRIITIGRGTVLAPDEFDQTTSRGGVTPPLREPTLGQIVAYFKYQSTKKINSIDHSGVITKIWQRNYYEHIIRDNEDMKRIWKYIESNPIMWADDDENPVRL